MRRRTLGRGGWTATRALGALALLITALAVAACGDGSSSATSGVAPRATSASGASSATSGAQSDGPTPTSTPSNATATAASGGVQAGLSEFCGAPPTVSVQPPSTIPAYPNAQLHVGQSGNTGQIFGYCVGDTPNAVADFYVARLPGKGWTQVAKTTIDPAVRVSATQGNTTLLVTALPDAQTPNQTEIILNLSQS